MKPPSLSEQFAANEERIAGGKEVSDLLRENRRLREALENLINASGHMSPFGTEATVKNVRLAGKYMQALDAARAALTNAA